MGKVKVMKAIDIIPEKVIDFCELKFDHKIRPQVHFVFDKRYKTKYGEYEVGKIIIYPHNIPSTTRLIKTLIHEYIHHLQLNHWRKMENYFLLLREFGYEDQPQEVEANDIQQYYYKECIEYLKSHGCLK